MVEGDDLTNQFHWMGGLFVGRRGHWYRLAWKATANCIAAPIQLLEYDILKYDYGRIHKTDTFLTFARLKATLR